MPPAARPISRLFLHLVLVLALVLQATTVLAMRGAHGFPQAEAIAAASGDAPPPCHMATTADADQNTTAAPEQPCCTTSLAGLCQWACSMAMTPLPPALFVLPSLANSQQLTTPSAGLSSHAQRVPLRPPIA
jgi:hypothetical protein